MPSPFPGMDPYLEHPKHWQPFQHQLLACLYQILLPGLVDRYRARVGTRASVSQTVLCTSVLSEDQRLQGPVPPMDEVQQHFLGWTNLQWIDWTTRWGLLAVGVCLLLGFLTRPACLVGAAFLALFYLSQPPFPWVPEVLRSEGHYLFVNKNLIEALALLALATLPTGRWVGLDGLLQFLNPWRWRAREAETDYRERELVAAGGRR